MIIALKVVALVLVVGTVIPSAAHVLELPGKHRLSQQDYLAVQRIYYPGFSIIGAAEPLSILMLLVLLVFAPRGTAAFWLIAAAAVASAATHLLYWILTAPVNKVWLSSESLSAGARRFFGAGGSTSEADWKTLRDRWEWSHVWRAAFSVLAFVLLTTALIAAS